MFIIVTTHQLYQQLYFITDIQCDSLSIPANGNVFCSSGRVGVGYVGDTCSFKCNIGYELTGSGTRTCRSDGSWSGINITCGRGIYFIPVLFDITCA